MRPKRTWGLAAAAAALCSAAFAAVVFASERSQPLRGSVPSTGGPLASGPVQEAALQYHIELAPTLTGTFRGSEA
jgi:hypothetical protein